MQKLHEMVTKAEENYINGNTTISKYVSHSMYETLETVDAYLNSQHLSGKFDSLEREKPFFNIVTSAVNVWYRATDIDRRHIRVKATQESDYTTALLANIHLHRWMKEINFGKFLNQWGRSLSRYGSTVVKFVEQGGQLYPTVVPWNRLIVDAVDFEGNMVIEKLYYTPAQLKKMKNYDQEVIKTLLETTESRETIDGQKKDTLSDYIEVYEVHGELPLSLLTDNENDEDTYRQQMHVVSFVKQGDSDDVDSFTLYSGKEKKSPYQLTHLIEEDGRTLSIGAVESLFEAQWMQNHTAKAIKDQLDIASKLIFQTADESFIGRNVLAEMESGLILTHADNQPLTQVNNGGHDITSLQAYGEQWRVLAQDITSTPDSVRGNTMPSGTAYRQVAILNEEANSLFEIMVENKGLAIEDMMTTYILPYIKTKMDTGEEVAMTLEDYDLAQIDAIHVPTQAVKQIDERIKDTLLNQGRTVTAEEMNLEVEEIAVRDDLAKQGNERFFTPDDAREMDWKAVLKDFEWQVDVEVTNENTDKEATMTTLSTVLQSIGQNPQLLQDPNARMILGKILEETGKLSPVQLAQTQQPTPVQPEVQGQEQGSGSLLEELTPNNQNG